MWTNELCMELGESEPHSINTFHSVVLKHFIYVCILHSHNGLKLITKFAHHF
jgi:hypothetical protein